MKTKKSSWGLFVDATSSGDKVLVYAPWRIIGFPFFVLGLRTSISGNLLTFLSFVVSISGALLFITGFGYYERLIAAMLIQIGLGIDNVDGALARAKNQASVFGGWLAILFVTMKTSIIWSCISIGVFFNTNDSTDLIFGVITVAHLFISYVLLYVKNLMKIQNIKINSTFKIKNHRLGLENSLDLIIFIFAVMNLIDYLPKFMSIAGIIPWLLLIYSTVVSINLDNNKK